MAGARDVVDGVVGFRPGDDIRCRLSSTGGIAYQRENMPTTFPLVTVYHRDSRELFDPLDY